ncbi:hypothetical protein BAZSYMA_ACONTIG95193_0 [Bathymodiolus azoricus thioautotrophic gill symbiont]|uniref:Uncharacterized protein n=1 Tax=Bathymodiolus azoricus thioautotrophic gill symbiont TaxID=235205 RepID=A0A1H6JDK1_9GAMM|nr:hypothetical protein BAZSYMA_ACONTIG95193_0 [Bathymodiolus azoricus thioautotrophic gill symbiont]
MILTLSRYDGVKMGPPPKFLKKIKYDFNCFFFKIYEWLWFLF